MAGEAIVATARLTPMRTILLRVVLVAALVLVTCLIGIWTRPTGLASIWPANAVLLGIFVRNPALARSPLCWAAAAIGYATADLATGNTVEATLWLNSANLLGVAVGVLVFSRFKPEDRRLGRPLSINFVFFGCLAASAGAAVIGTIAMQRLFGGSALEGVEIWFAAELANYMIYLPVLLAAPRLRILRRDGWWSGAIDAAKPAIFPGVVLLACLGLWLLELGPAVLALPIPVLLWCALRTGVFITALFSLVTITWVMFMVGRGMLDPITVGDPGSGLATFQVCLAILAMGPISVACNMDTQESLLKDLRSKADLDQLTGTLTKREFTERAERMCQELTEERRPLALMMIDLDYFKKINDTFGHAAGDAVLASFGQVAVGVLRDTDLVGRVGGEEFAVLLPGIGVGMSSVVAERIREQSAEDQVECREATVTYTVSIGLAHFQAVGQSLDVMLATADAALYRAKEAGRNRIELH